MKQAANKKYETSIPQLVISVPAEFNEVQRNFTAKAAELAGNQGFYHIICKTIIFEGLEVRRIVSEPTAAALAYGLHKKKGVEYIIVFDLGTRFFELYILILM